MHPKKVMAITQEILLNKLRELSHEEDGRYLPVDLELLRQYFKTPIADIIAMLHEMEKWELVKVKLDKGYGRNPVLTGHVVLKT